MKKLIANGLYAAGYKAATERLRDAHADPTLIRARRAMLSKGLSTRMLEEELGTFRGSVSKVLRGLRVNTVSLAEVAAAIRRLPAAERPRSRRLSPRIKSLRARLARHGISNAELCTALGRCRATVARALTGHPGFERTVAAIESLVIAREGGRHG